MAVTKKQIHSLLDEVAKLIVNDKTKIVVLFSKSGVNTVTKETKNSILCNQVIENLSKNKAFAKNFAALITDINLSEILDRINLNNADGKSSSDIGANFGKKIEAAILSLSNKLSESKKVREEYKTKLKEKVKEQIAILKDKKNAEAWYKRNKVLNNVGLTLIVLGAVSSIGIGIYMIRENIA